MLILVDFNNPRHCEIFDSLKLPQDSRHWRDECKHDLIIYDSDTGQITVALEKGKVVVTDGAIPIDIVPFIDRKATRPYLTSACYIGPGLDLNKIPSIKAILDEQFGSLGGPIAKMVRDIATKVFEGPKFNIQENMGPTIAEVRNNPKLLFDYE